MNRPHPYTDSQYNGFIKGQWYRAVVLGEKFHFWVRRKLMRNELRVVALDYIGKEGYEKEDIDSVRMVKGPPE